MFEALPAESSPLQGLHWHGRPWLTYGDDRDGNRKGKVAAQDRTEADTVARSWKFLEERYSLTEYGIMPNIRSKYN